MRPGRDADAPVKLFLITVYLALSVSSSPYILLSVYLALHISSSQYIWLSVYLAFCISSSPLLECNQAQTKLFLHTSHEGPCRNILVFILAISDLFLTASIPLTLGDALTQVRISIFAKKTGSTPCAAF